MIQFASLHPSIILRCETLLLWWLLLQGSVPLHWPLVNSPGRMIEQLGKQEFEQKRKEDALAYKKSQPGYRLVILLLDVSSLLCCSRSPCGVTMAALALLLTW